MFAHFRGSGGRPVKVIIQSAHTSAEVCLHNAVYAPRLINVKCVYLTGRVSLGGRTLGR